MLTLPRRSFLVALLVFLAAGTYALAEPDTVGGGGLKLTPTPNTSYSTPADTR